MDAEAPFMVLQTQIFLDMDDKLDIYRQLIYKHIMKILSIVSMGIIHFLVDILSDIIRRTC